MPDKTISKSGSRGPGKKILPPRISSSPLFPAPDSRIWEVKGEFEKRIPNSGARSQEDSVSLRSSGSDCEAGRSEYFTF